jgi:hypothetical protein
LIHSGTVSSLSSTGLFMGVLRRKAIAFYRRR